MRPVERGEVPHIFAHYKEAAPYLKARLGRYCSYCERWIATGIAVEHISPKSNDADRALEWSNFLLACMDCNSTKGAKALVHDQCLWPDTDNTFHALIYREDGALKPNPKLNDSTALQVQCLLNLVGLNKQPKDDNGHRWDDRIEAWDKAVAAKRMIEIDEAARPLAIKTVTGHGHWSIWMTVFADDADMQSRLIEAFPGTARARLAITPY
ncbi:MAG: HNH endonuclease [Cytophagales bacterium]|nr:HNH endonuclease [Cytophagales bacterium]